MSDSFWWTWSRCVLNICSFTLFISMSAFTGIRLFVSDKIYFSLVIIGNLLNIAGLGYQYVFAPIEKSWSGRKYNDGPAIFSKYPIITSEKYILSETKSRMPVKADIEINNVKLHIFNTHLLHVHQKESDIQNEQVSALIKVLPVDRTIVMGDFNATPESTVIREMKTALIDTDPASSPTWSVYPAGCDECNQQALDTKLDYIFKTKDIKTDSFEVRKSEGSDHLPISVLVEI